MARKKQPPEPLIATRARDSAMARLAAAMAASQSAMDCLLECAGHFALPEEDKDGGEREDLLEGADEALGHASRAVQACQADLERMTDEDCQIGEVVDDEDTLDREAAS